MLAMARYILKRSLAISHEFAVLKQRLRLPAFAAIAEGQVAAARQIEDVAARVLGQRAEHSKRRTGSLVLDPDHPVVGLVVLLKLLPKAHPDGVIAARGAYFLGWCRESRWQRDTQEHTKKYCGTHPYF